MAQFNVDNLQGSNGSLTFLIREVNETNGNRFISYNPVSKVVIFNEIQDGQLHNYSVTISSPGCQDATQIIPFQCTAVGACDPVHNGVIIVNGLPKPGEPLNFTVTNLYGSTPYTYLWSTTGGGVISSTTDPSTYITYTTPGTYTVTVTVGNCGTTPAIITKSITIENNV